MFKKGHKKEFSAENGGHSIIRTSKVFMILAVALMVMLLILGTFGAKEFGSIKYLTNSFITCSDAIQEMQLASEYLTDQSRMFVLTGKPEYLRNYMDEVERNQRREKSVEVVKESFGDTSAPAYMTAAKDASDSLLNSEMYAMKLTAVAFSIPSDRVHQAVQNIELKPEDAAADSYEQRRIAQELVTGHAYQSRKLRLLENLSNANEQLAIATQNSQNRVVRIYRDIYYKMLLAALLNGVILLVGCILSEREVVLPISHFAESVRNGSLFPIRGASEIRSLAATYNAIFVENEEAQRQLRYTAEHDALTDIYNRGYFNKKLKEFEEQGRAFALLIIDVDKFKEINDSYGHEAGDRVLIKLASKLKKGSRSWDIPCRLGGDEFAMLLPGTDAQTTAAIKENVGFLRSLLKEESDWAPSATISVGVAFENGSNSEGSAYRNADDALYFVKSHGRDGVCVYNDISTE